MCHHLSPKIKHFLLTVKKSGVCTQYFSLIGKNIRIASSAHELVRLLMLYIFFFEAKFKGIIFKRPNTCFFLS